MAVGEGGGELVKQLLCDTYDIAYPGVVGVYLTGKPSPAVGPHDIAIAIVGASSRTATSRTRSWNSSAPASLP